MTILLAIVISQDQGMTYQFQRSQLYSLSTNKNMRYPRSGVSDNLEGRVANEGRYGSRDIVGGDEGHDGDHGKTAVVELTVLLLGHGLGVDAREINGRENNGGVGSSLGVVSSLGLGDHLGNEDGEKDLRLAGIGDGGPGIEGLHAGERLEGDVVAEHAGEVDARSLDDVAGGGKHGNTAVLELGGTEPEEGLLTSRGGKGEGVEVLDGGGAAGHVIKAQAELSGGLSTICINEKI